MISDRDMIDGGLILMFQVKIKSKAGLIVAEVSDGRNSPSTMNDNVRLLIFIIS